MAVWSFENMQKNGIAESSSRFILSFMMILHTDFKSGWTTLQFHEHLIRVHFPQCPLKCLLSVVLLTLATLDWVR